MTKITFAIIASMMLTALSVKLIPDVIWPILWAMAGTAIIAVIEKINFRI